MQEGSFLRFLGDRAPGVTSEERYRVTSTEDCFRETRAKFIVPSHIHIRRSMFVKCLMSYYRQITKYPHLNTETL